MYTLQYHEAKKHIQNADILLFRSGGFPSIGWWISKYTGGVYSHVGLANWYNSILECVEQREFRGGRSVNLETQVKLKPNRIDVYRLSPTIKRLFLVHSIVNNTTEIIQEDLQLTKQIQDNIVLTAKELTGQKYGWTNIFEILKGYTPIFRLLRQTKTLDNEINQAYVCSTLVAYSIRKNYIDIVPHLSDKRTTPVDISRSTLINYLFTIGSV